MNRQEKDAVQKYEDVDLGVMSFVKSGERWLDLGCGTGSLGAAIKKKNNKVYGIEYSHSACKVARTRLDQVWQGDISRPEKILRGEKFDCILFGNILEHLTDPWSTIRKYRKYLTKDGRIIVSIPNVATWTSRLKLFFGVFGYTEVGTYDFTHLRFFNYKTARDLIEGNGYIITKVTVNPNIVRPLTPLFQYLFRKNSGDNLNRVQVNQNILNSKPYKIYTKTLYPIETFIAKLWKNLLAFQFVFEAKKDI